VKRFVLGTRASALALAQAELTRVALLHALPELEIETKTFVTRGDQKLDLSLIRANEAGGKGLFTRELEEALIAGSIDVAVHSLKDLPGENPAGLAITAVLERAATADVLITKTPTELMSLPAGAKIGTSSVRRARQLGWLRPDLSFVEWRGNVQTRLRKLGENPDVAGIVLAQAGLDRLGFDCDSGAIEAAPFRFHVTSLREHLLPAIGQGAIALQSRADRLEVTGVLARIDHAPTHFVIRAERELQRLLAGDCALPVGVRTELSEQMLRMDAILFDPEENAPPQRGSAERSRHLPDAPEAVAAEVFSQLAEVRGPSSHL
jgi:hydroxymethylbilane synthase